MTERTHRLAETLLERGVNSIIYPYVVSYIKNVDESWNYILPGDLKEELEKTPDRYFLLDVRKADVYNEGHIPGSVNIFWLDLFKLENLEKLPFDKTIVVICYIGHTASQALTLLRLLGYDAITLKFGMGVSPDPKVPVKGWLSLGFPVEKTEAAK